MCFLRLTARTVAVIVFTADIVPVLSPLETVVYETCDILDGGGGGGGCASLGRLRKLLVAHHNPN